MSARHLIALIMAVAVIVVPVASNPGPAPAAAAIAASSMQPDLNCPGCSFETQITSWNGTGPPGSVHTAIIQIDNTGERPDRYRIAFDQEPADWTVQVEPDRTTEVPAGSGVFASQENQTSVEVIVVIGPDAAAGQSGLVVVSVTSETMAQDAEGRNKSIELLLKATQVHAWVLECGPPRTVQKSNEVSMKVQARNTGNGPDQARLRIDAHEHIIRSEPEPFDLAAAGNGTRNIQLGASLRLEDGNHTLAFRLERENGNTVATCLSTLTVTGGQNTGADPDRPDVTKDSPSPTVPAILLALLGAYNIRKARLRPDQGERIR